MSRANFTRLGIETLEDRCTPAVTGFAALGGNHAAVLMVQFTDGDQGPASYFRVLPNGHVQIPVDPCLPGLLHAAGPLQPTGG